MLTRPDFSPMFQSFVGSVGIMNDGESFYSYFIIQPWGIFYGYKGLREGIASGSGIISSNGQWQLCELAITR